MTLLSVSGQSRVQDGIDIELCRENARRSTLEERGLLQFDAKPISRQHVRRRDEIVHARREEHDAGLRVDRELAHAAQEIPMLPPDRQVARPLDLVEAHASAPAQRAKRRFGHGHSDGNGRGLGMREIFAYVHRRKYAQADERGARVLDFGARVGLPTHERQAVP